MKLAIVCVLLFVAAGCKGVTMTANYTANPVLFGPVRSLGSRSASGGEPIGSFVTEMDKSMTTVPTGVSVAGDTVTASAATFAGASSAIKMDADIRDATGGNTRRPVAVTGIHCGGYFLYPLFVMRDSAWCEASGDVFEASAAPVARAPEKSLPAGRGELDVKAARASVAAAAAGASACAGNEPAGDVQVVVVFGPSGKTTSVQVEGDEVVKTNLGECIAAAFQGVTVPPFEGEPVTVRKTISLGQTP